MKDFEMITGLTPTPIQEAILGVDTAMRQTGRTTAKAFVAIREAAKKGTTVKVTVGNQELGKHFLKVVHDLLERFNWPAWCPEIGTVRAHGIFFKNGSSIYIHVPRRGKTVVVEIFETTELLSGVEGTI